MCAAVLPWSSPTALAPTTAAFLWAPARCFCSTPGVLLCQRVPHMIPGKLAHGSNPVNRPCSVRLCQCVALDACQCVGVQVHSVRALGGQASGCPARSHGRRATHRCRRHWVRHGPHEIASGRFHVHTMVHAREVATMVGAAGAGHPVHKLCPTFDMPSAFIASSGASSSRTLLLLSMVTAATSHQSPTAAAAVGKARPAVRCPPRSRRRASRVAKHFTATRAGQERGLWCAVPVATRPTTQRDTWL